MSLTRELARRTAGIRSERLEPADLDAVRTLLVDQLAVSAGGARTESAAAARRFVADIPAESSATMPIFGTPDNAPALNAAIANAVAGHSIEYDDVHNPSSSHPGVVIFHAA